MAGYVVVGTQWETGWTQPRMGAIERMASVFNVSLREHENLLG